MYKDTDMHEVLALGLRLGAQRGAETREGKLRELMTTTQELEARVQAVEREGRQAVEEMRRTFNDETAHLQSTLRDAQAANAAITKYVEEELARRIESVHFIPGDAPDVRATDTRLPVDIVHSKDDDVTTMQALARWVAAKRADCKQTGDIFDTTFRCVSEGGELFYFDPEVLVDLLWHYRQVYLAVVKGEKPPKKSMSYVSKCWMPDEES